MTPPDIDGSQQADAEQPLVTHLMELRDRLLRVVIAVLVIFGALVGFARDLYHLIAIPLLDKLPENGGMIATDPAGTFFTPMKLTMVLSVFIAIPYILYQAWAFVAPGLYRHERKLVMPLLVSSTVLFYAGMAFAYLVVLPLFFGFITLFAPEGVAVMPDIGKYLDLLLKLFFAFGFAFEVPVAVVLLVWIGVTTPEALTAKRAYVVVGAFVVGMLLTPPDIISQTLLAVPLWLLFEAGVYFSRYFLRLKREHEEETEQEAEEDMDAMLERYEAEEAALHGRDDDEEGSGTPKA